MKALSLWQPWATLWASGAKRYETRSWRPGDVPDVLAVHAAKRWTLASQAIASSSPFFEALQGKPGVEFQTSARLPMEVASSDVVGMPLGAIVGVVFPGPAQPTDRERRHASERELRFGDWTPGRWAWPRTDGRLLLSPVKCRGQQGVWELSPETTKAVLDTLKAEGMHV